jgi:hypothetical protein
LTSISPSLSMYSDDQKESHQINMYTLSYYYYYYILLLLLHT